MIYGGRRKKVPRRVRGLALKSRQLKLPGVSIHSRFANERETATISESRRPLAGNIERLLQGKPCLAQRSLIKQPPNQRNPVWHPPRR